MKTIYEIIIYDFPFYMLVYTTYYYVKVAERNDFNMEII